MSLPGPTTQTPGTAGTEALDVSVVIPTRGRHELLRRAIASAIGQEPRPREIVVVADGPDPGLADVLGGVEASGLRLVELPEAAGAQAARNAGVAAATSTWLALLDDDDEWRPAKLRRQLAAAAAAACPEPIVTCAVEVRSPRGIYVMPRRYPAPNEPVSEWLTVRHGLLRGGFVQTSSLFASRELFRRIPFDPGMTRLQDLDWLLRAVHGGACFVPVPEPLSIWHADEDRPRVTHGADWQQLLHWAQDHRDLFTDRAYAAFLLGAVASIAARGDRRGFGTLLREARRRGQPRPLDYLTYLQIWIVPPGLRGRLRDRWLRAVVKAPKDSRPGRRSA